MNIRMLDAQKLLVKIKSLGYEAYIVGGAVRDLLLGEDPQDIDIATNCPMKVLEENFSTHDVGRSKDFGILTVRSLHLSGVWYEVSQFRVDGKYSDGRHPDEVSLTSSFEEDVRRRDFTVNAMGLSSNSELIDFVGGEKDLENRVIRAVGDPTKRFEEDRLRMVRAARFASRTGFTLDKATKKAIKKMADRIYLVNDSPDRIRMEFVKAAKKTGKEFARFIILLDELRLLHRLLPEVAAMKYFDHDMAWHPEGRTVFDHTIKCLETMEYEAPISKLAVLLHDLGKTVRFQEKHGWKLSYHTHERASVALTEEVARYLNFSLPATKALLFAVGNHMKFQYITSMKPSKLVRLVNSTYFPVLLDVAKADEFSRGEVFTTRDEFNAKIKRALEIKAVWEHHINDHKAKLVDGKDIMSITGLPPSPLVGKIKKMVEDHIIDNNVDPRDLEKVREIVLKTFNELKKEEEL